MNTVRLTGKDIALLIDPYPKSSGLPEIKSANDATLLTVPSGDLPSKAGMVIDGPGEYEIKGAMITGVPARLHTDAAEDVKRAAVYSIVIDGNRIGFLGNIDPSLSGEQAE